MATVYDLCEAEIYQWTAAYFPNILVWRSDYFNTVYSQVRRRRYQMPPGIKTTQFPDSLEALGIFDTQ